MSRLSDNQAAVLGYLKAHPKRTTVQIAEALVMSESSVRHATGALFVRRLVERAVPQLRQGGTSWWAL